MQIFRKLPDRKRLLAPGRLPVSPGIQSNYPVLILKIPDLMLKITAIFSISVKQYQ